MNLERVLGWTFPEIRSQYSPRDTMLYALGVAACSDPLDAGELRFVYEGALQALPSQVCVLAHPGFWLRATELQVNWLKLVHAEQRFELHAPLPPQGEVLGRYRITGVVDKGADKGALLYFRKSLYGAGGELLADVESTYFVRADGGCGNWGAASAELPATPESVPHGSLDTPVLPIAALIYRLSGDYNPLHADPEVARKAGFERPILHGLCTYGVACQALVRGLADGNAARLRSMAARFTKPVYPGETLRTQWWRGAVDAVQFRMLSLERNEVVLDRGTARVLPA